MDTLRETWQFFAGAFVTVLVSSAVYVMQRRKKELSYGLISNTRIINLESKDRQRITLMFDGTLIADPVITVIRLFNSGNIAINRSDFGSDISIIFEDPGKVVSVEVVKRYPSDLDVALVFNTSRIELSPVLLNTGDYVDIKVLLDSPSQTFSVDARIADIKRIRQYKQIEYFKRNMSALSYFASPIVLTMFITALGVATVVDPPGESQAIARVIAGVVLTSLLWAMVLLPIVRGTVKIRGWFGGTSSWLD